MKEIHRLLEPGEPILPTDEKFLTTFKWVPRTDVKPGEVMTAAHHPHRRRQKVSEATERYYSRDEFACAAMAGMCADLNKIEDAQRKLPGGMSMTIAQAVSDLSYQMADAMVAERDTK